MATQRRSIPNNPQEHSYHKMWAFPEGRQQMGGIPGGHGHEHLDHHPTNSRNAHAHGWRCMVQALSRSQLDDRKSTPSQPPALQMSITPVKVRGRCWHRFEAQSWLKDSSIKHKSEDMSANRILC